VAFLSAEDLLGAVQQSAAASEGTGSARKREAVMEESLSLAIDAGPNMTTVQVAGEIDLAATPERRECLGTLAGDVVLEVSGVSFIDSQGLGFLIGEHRRRAARGERLILRGVAPTAMRVMTITGVDQVLNLDSSEPEASAPAA
jgi:anti-sigma B factor antagonist